MRKLHITLTVFTCGVHVIPVFYTHSKKLLQEIEFSPRIEAHRKRLL